MKIIVTGGTGFLGRHVVWRLSRAGHHVVFTGRNEVQAQLVQRGAGGGTRVEFIALDHGSNSAAAQMQACCAGAAAVVHCAALASPWGSRDAFRRSNVDATRQVIEACTANGIGKMVHISSPSIYFNCADRLGIREDDPLPHGVNEYARTKLAAEQLVLAAGLPRAVILRPRAIFGPWDQALLPRLVRLMRFGRVPLLRGGRALIDLTYVDNAVDAIELALDAGESLPGQPAVFNISNGEPIEAAALFEQLSEQFGLPADARPRNYRVAHAAAMVLEAAARLVPGWEPPFTRYSLGTIAFSQTLDLARARQVLGYQPRISLHEGIMRTRSWWRDRSHAP